MATVRFDIPVANRLASLPVETLNRIFAHLLVDAVARNDQLPSKGAITRFHSKQPPPLEIGAYLERLTRYTPFPRDAVLLAVVYLNRITHLPYTGEPNIHPVAVLGIAPPRLPPRPPAPPPRSPPVSPGHLTAPTSPIEAPSPLPPSPTISSVQRPRVAPFLNSYTLHRLVLAVLLIACKFAADGTLSQTRAAKVGGVGASELCKLEGECLRLLGWELMWSLGELESTCRELERVGEEQGMIPREAEHRIQHAVLTAIPNEEARPPGTDPPHPETLVSSPRSHFLNVPRPPLSTTSTSASLSAGSTAGSSEASTSQPSSSASSPQLFAPCDPLCGRKALPGAIRAVSARRARGALADGAADDTPPSSPSASSADECDVAVVEVVADKEVDGRVLNSRASSETVRKLEEMQLSAS